MAPAVYVEENRTLRRGNFARPRTFYDGGFPVSADPNFREVLVLTIMAVVRRQHLSKLGRQFLFLLRGISVLFAGLMVANREARATAIAQLKHFDRIGRIFR